MKYEYQKSLFTLGAIFAFALLWYIQQDSEINVLWFMAVRKKKKFFANINAIRCVHVASKSALNYRKLFLLYIWGDCDHMYVSACHVIILYFSASLHLVERCVAHIVACFHHGDATYEKEKGINLKFEPRGTKTSLIQTLHVIMLHGSVCSLSLSLS